MVKNLSATLGTWVQSLGQEDPLKKGISTHSSILAGKTLGQKRLASYSSRGHKASDAAEQLTHAHVNEPSLA